MAHHLALAQIVGVKGDGKEALRPRRHRDQHHAVGERHQRGRSVGAVEARAGEPAAVADAERLAAQAGPGAVVGTRPECDDRVDNEKGGVIKLNCYIKRNNNNNKQTAISLQQSHKGKTAISG